MKKAPFLFGLTLASAIAVPALAELPTAPTAEHWSAGALLGYGFKDGVNFGLGVRGGYTLPQNVYLGGTFMYHFGKSEGPASVNVFYLGVEGGYDFFVDPIIIRPYLGLGPAFGHVSGGGVLPSDTETKFGVWPGVSVLYPINNFFVGGDTRVLIVSDFTAFNLFATGGVTF
jgi:hypothetical protein